MNWTAGIDVAAAGLQWTLSYPSSDIAAIALSAGPALTATGKSLDCNTASGSTICLATGMNLNTIGSGVVAIINVTLAASVASPSVNIAVGNTLGASPEGNGVAVTGSGGVVSVQAAAPVLALTGIQCNPAVLASGSAASCTVALSSAAGAAGVAVSLSDDNALLSVPASVTVVAGSMSATVTVTMGSITADQTATITATYNGVSRSTTISLAAPIVVSSIICSPSTLSSNAVTTCSIAVSKAAASSGAAVSLASNTALLPAPPSVTIPAGATSASVSLTSGAIPGDQTATITASLNGVSRTATVSLSAPLVLSSIACSPANLSSNASGACTISVSKPAPAAGVAVSLTSNAAALAVPASVTIASGAAAATVNITAGTITADQTATITATLDGVSRSSSVSLIAPVAVSSLVCAPSTLSSGASSACTVTLSKAAPAALGVAISAGGTSITAPPSVAIAASSTTASFTVQANAVAMNQAVTITASYAGSSRSTTISLTAPVAISSLACTPSGLISGAAANCVVTLSQPAPANTSVSISSNSTLVATPPSVMVPASGSTAFFAATAGTISADVTAAVTATLGSSSRTATLTLWSPPELTSFTCWPTRLSVGASSACTLTLSKAAGNVTVAIASSSPAALAAPAAAVSQGGTIANFSVTAQASTGGWPIVTAMLNNVKKSVVFTISGAGRSPGEIPGGDISLVSLSCSPAVLDAGGAGLCRVGLHDVTSAATARIRLFSSNESIQLPHEIEARPGQASVDFQIASPASAVDLDAVITADLGMHSASETVTIERRRRPLIQVPGAQLVEYGTDVRFRVSVLHADAVLKADSLPAGAVFDPVSGLFEWTPNALQQGSHRLVFSATSPAGESDSAQVAVTVDSGAPKIDRVMNAASRSPERACSPGAIGSIEGRRLAEPGSTLRVNGSAVAVLSVSPARIDFLCPEVSSGRLEFVVETPRGITEPLHSAAGAIAPGIFSLDGSGTGQGIVFHAGTGALAMTPNHVYTGQSAMPGDCLVVQATGIAGAARLAVRIGSAEVSPDAIEAVPELPGVYRVAITLPHTAVPENAAISLLVQSPDGAIVESNPVRIGLAREIR